MMAEEGSSPPRPSASSRRIIRSGGRTRVIIDVSMHARDVGARGGGAPAQRARPRQRLAQAEARRYAAYPTYQLCYAVGRRDILALREDARRERGASYTARAFHDELSGYGALPTVLARWGMGLS
jgi:uncharacterized protein (DUF885 family)